MGSEKDKWSEYSYGTFSQVFTDFQTRQKTLGKVYVYIKGGENKLPAKTLLKYYQAPRDIEMSTSLCNDFFLNKEVLFVYKGDEEEKEIHHLVFGGGDITEKFDTCPYLLDILFDMAHGLLIKKLMPPSFDSRTPESGLEETESQKIPTA